MDDKRKAIEKALQSLKRRNVETVEKVDLLNQLAGRFANGEVSERMLAVSLEACELARRLQYQKGEANALTCLGFALWLKSDLKKATQHLLEAKSLFEKIEDPDGAAKNLISLAGLYRSLGDYDQSISSSLGPLEYFRKNSDSYWEGIVLLNLGYTYHLIGDYERSLRHHQALVERAVDPGEEWLAGRAMDGIGLAYQCMGEPEKALQYYKKSLQVFHELGFQMGKARTLNDLGSLCQVMGDDKKALEYYLRSLKIREEIHLKDAQCTTLINLGKLFIQKRDSSKAMEFLEKALNIAEQLEVKAKTYQAHQALSQAYELNDDLPNVLMHYKAYHQTKEEVFSEASNTKIKNLQTRFEVEKSQQDAEITRLRNIELKEKNDQLEQLLSELKAAQTQLVQSEKMAVLGQLTAGIAHEINTPIGVIKSNAHVITRCIAKLKDLSGENKNVDKDRENHKLLKVLGDSSQISSTASERIAKIVSTLKSFTRLDEAEFERVDIHEGLDNTLTLIQHEIKDGTDVVKEYGQIPEIFCCPSELNQVFMTLLNNAAQAIERKGTVTIRTSAEKQDHVCVKISDTGKGIPSEQLATIFALSFVTKGSRIGMSMGLVNAYDIIQKHQGELSVESEVGRGSTFTILLPRG
jgi:signal transduction histidine kinase